MAGGRSEKAAARMLEKRKRAKKLGMIVPDKKVRNGWAILRFKLREGKLVRDLKVATGDTSVLEDKQTTMAAMLKSHMSDVAYQAASRKSTGMTMLDAKLVVEHQKATAEIQKKLRQERAYRRRLIARQKKLERELEYLNFPSILGWYFDGFFTPYFQLNEEWAAIFNEMERGVAQRKESSTKETFIEKAKRYFWPPTPLCMLCFRTRGIYLDFPQIIKDPPHTPPEIILDQRMEAVTLFMAPGADGDLSRLESLEALEEILVAAGGDTVGAIDDAELQRLIKEIEDDPDMTPDEKAKKIKGLMLWLQKRKEMTAAQREVMDEMRFNAINKNDYYFDDQVPGFFKKKPRDRDKYYYDGTYDIWRKKRTIIYFATDYYWDEQLAMYFPKDRTRPKDYYIWDPNNAVYRLKDQRGAPNWRGIKPQDFYIDYSTGKWRRVSKAPRGIFPKVDKNGKRYCVNKEFDTPDDFFFDFDKQTFETKAANVNYVYDVALGCWKLEGAKPVKRSKKPLHYYWNEEEHAFIMKDAPSSFFVWDGNSNFFRKKKSLHGKFHPKNWTWNEKKKRWELRKFGKKGNRPNLLSDSLYWRPDRDYDKPWLEYVGGFRDYHIEYDYELLNDDDGAGVEVVVEDKDKEKKIQFSASEPNLKGPKAQADVKGIIKEGADSQTQLAFVDTLDRKVLKITNLSDRIADMDLRKYFANVKKIVRPKVPNTEMDEDYAYLKFKTEEAAAAALKTMHTQEIYGQQVKLAYKLKAEDEEVGGQSDIGPEQPTIL